MDNIRGMSAAVQKTMLKSIITSLLDHSKPLYRYFDEASCDFNWFDRYGALIIPASVQKELEIFYITFLELRCEF